MNDADFLAACPDAISIADVFKATPAMEGGKRFIYFQASNQGLDQQGEVVVAKALADSSDFYLRFGNVDIDHLTKIGPRLGIPNSSGYEIGQPKEVRQSGHTTFVKAEIYSGDGHMADQANQFWSSLVDLRPPARWYASVCGQALNKAVEIDPQTQARKVVIQKMRWTNIGMSKTPVNQHLDACTTVPVGAFAKCLTAAGFIDVTKALEAGYGTDSATLAGGGALRKQSIQRVVTANYFDFRNRVAKALRAGEVGKNAKAADIAKFSERSFGMSPDEAAENTERFMRDLKNGIRKGSSK